MTVSTASVARADWATPVEASGVITAWQEAIVSARAVGVPLIDVRADVGDIVSKGQVLARFDDRSARAELAQAEASVVQANANARLAEVNRDRALALKGSGALSEQDVLQLVTQAESAAAQQEVAQAALATARVRLENTQVRAPDAGVITSRSATLGQVAGTGMELFRLTRQGRLEWRAELTAQQLNLVRPGMAASVTLPNGGVARGNVRLVAPALDPTSRLGFAYVDLEPGSAARGAMYADGKIELAESPALIVPGESVVVRDGRSYVFRVNGDTVERVAVTVGRRQGDWIEITQGVQPGEQVAVRGAGFLNDGDTVRISDPAVAAAGA